MAKKQGKDNLFWEAYNNMAQKSEQRKFRAFVKNCGRDWHNFKQTDCRTPIAKLPAHLALSLCNYLGWNLQETISKELSPPTKHE